MKNKDYVDLILNDAHIHTINYMGLVDENNKINFYDGQVRVVNPEGKQIAKFAPQDYVDHIAEHVEPWTYITFPYLKDIGWKGFVDGSDSGIVRVAPLARCNVADGMATPLAQAAYEKMFETLGGKPAHTTLALGNDILGDDSAAFVAARTLKSKFEQRVDFIDTNETGLALLDVMTSYDRVLLLDTVVTGEHKSGTILAFSKADFNKVLGSSPHFMGLPEVIELAKILNIEFPRIIHILAIEIEQPSEFSEILSPVVEHVMPEYIEKAVMLLKQWCQCPIHNEYNN